MKDCLVLGRSPFINKVKWKKVDFDRYFVICCNYPVPDIPVDIVIARDDSPNPVLAPATKFISPRTGYRFVPEAKKENEVEFCCYTSSSAVWLSKKLGFERSILIGIDHIEDDKPFIHYDGIVNNGIASALSNKLCKEYISRFKGVYQTNPQVYKDWKVPYLNIELLYR